VEASRGITDQCQVRGGQEGAFRHRNVGPGGEQVRKGEGLAVKDQQYKAEWEGCQELGWNVHELIEEQRRCSEGLEGKQCWRRQGCASRSLFFLTRFAGPTKHQVSFYVETGDLKYCKSYSTLYT
jgi:hypothetical protein